MIEETGALPLDWRRLNDHYGIVLKQIVFVIAILQNSHHVLCVGAKRGLTVKLEIVQYCPVV